MPIGKWAALVGVVVGYKVMSRKWVWVGVKQEP